MITGNKTTAAKILTSWDFVVEPPIGIEPMTYALREARPRAVHAVPAPIPPIIAPTAPAALTLSEDPFHEPFHDRGVASRRPSGTKHRLGMTMRHEQRVAG